MKIQEKSGIRLLLEKYKAIFRTEENRNYYEEEDYRKAERKFLKYALEQRRMDIGNNVHSSLDIIVDHISQFAGIFEGHHLPG